MKHINSIKETLRSILPTSDNRPTSPPAPSHPVIPIKHLYAMMPDPDGTLVQYPGPLISLTPTRYTSGHLQYSTDGALAYRIALAELANIAKMTLLFAEKRNASSPPFCSWNEDKLDEEAAREELHCVECKVLPVLNVQNQALDLGSAWLDMDKGGTSRELMSASASWGVNVALVVRWTPGRRQSKPLPPKPLLPKPLPPKPLPSLPTTASDGGSTVGHNRRGSADSIYTVWPGPNAPRYDD